MISYCKVLLYLCDLPKTPPTDIWTRCPSRPTFFCCLSTSTSQLRQLRCLKIVNSINCIPGDVKMWKLSGFLHNGKQGISKDLCYIDTICCFHIASHKCANQCFHICSITSVVVCMHTIKYPHFFVTVCNSFKDNTKMINTHLFLNWHRFDLFLIILLDYNCYQLQLFFFILDSSQVSHKINSIVP